MKKQILTLVVVALVVATAIVLEHSNSNLSTAGGSGVNLKELNDTTKVNVVAFFEGNITSNQRLAQAVCVANAERCYSNGLYIGGDLLCGISTQFGVVTPVNDVRAGMRFDKLWIEAKVGTFKRNKVITTGFDPQFSNFLSVINEDAAVKDAVQLTLGGRYTKWLLGHQGGDNFYTFNGNYYTGLEINLRDVALSGGVNFTEQITGYAAAKWSHKNNVATITCSNIGCKEQNFVLSYSRNNINLKNNVVMNVGSAVWGQNEVTGWNLVASFDVNSAKLFTQAGLTFTGKDVNPWIGVGLKYTIFSKNT